MDKFCVITNREKDDNLKLTNEIVNYIRHNNKDCILLERFESPCKETTSFTDSKQIPEETECAIVLGGDGTIIQAAFDLLGKDIPILGVNLGTLGFLAETEKNEIFIALDKVFHNKYKLESRMMLQGNIYSSNKEIYSGVALNDIVISRSGFSRIISVCIYVNGDLVDRYRGDGVIISTPTGSTGYSLSCGGPVVKPDSQTMIITPISPHSLQARTIVVSSEDKVKVKIEKSKKTQEEEAIATFDGRQAILLHTEDEIDVSKSKEVTQLIKINNTSFFEILRTKIGQSGD